MFDKILRNNDFIMREDGIHAATILSIQITNKVDKEAGKG